MKSIRYILFAMSLTMAATASAQELAGSQVQIENKAVSLSAEAQLLVGMDVTVPANLNFSTNSMLTLTPILMEKGENGATKTLPAIYVYGRNRHLLTERSGDIPADAFEVLRRDNNKAQTVRYTTICPLTPTDFTLWLKLWKNRAIWVPCSAVRMPSMPQGSSSVKKERIFTTPM